MHLWRRKEFGLVCVAMNDPDALFGALRNSADPEVFTAPFTARLDWTRNDKYEFYEYACHEGNVQVRNYITSSRAGTLQEASQADRQAAGEGGGL